MPPVTVNGVAISRKAIAAEVQNFPVRNPGEGWRAATRALVVRELLLQEARRLDIAADQRTDQDGRRETVEDALVRDLIEREVRVPEADEDMLRRFYENNLRRFVTPALYEADHILIAARRDDREAFDGAREKALSMRSSLTAAPERFAALARDCSDCPSGALGGSLGQIGPGDTTPEFEAALGDLAPGEISSPVETRYGVHLIRLTRRIDGRQLPFEAVRERIASYLAEHVSRQATAQYVSLLVGRADIGGIALDGASSPLVQ
ncbi:peptidylprolyl isomerase [Mesorhizobium sp. VK25A]|uniref:Parvulin-like PPIase n=1 Tax=Mesorhizobium vachelliae TaxID=3072309 RepID=A0ABU5AEA4_9HYPH|nr:MULTISPECIES: peptidylprolyl isomerase [unclassified Mesorhizobium]MDX8535602.1 peptidylprolyl isomerase [Mesorhizobium sp. VK25D]MDX8548355.1 peptidylprolyl isomerase [Mesorhizobium sp. VK25A]